MSIEQTYLRLSVAMAGFLIGYLIGGGRTQWLIVFCASGAVSALYYSFRPKENNGTRR